MGAFAYPVVVEVTGPRGTGERAFFKCNPCRGETTILLK